MAGYRHKLRIIGGRYRGRRIELPRNAPVRPTSDAMRETLFNWLAPYIEGAFCLDGFAGSGAPGLEALSRGARHVTFIDCDRAAVAGIRSFLHMLQIPEHGYEAGDTAQPVASPEEVPAQVICADCIAWLQNRRLQGFDVIFLDPPFGQGLLSAASSVIDKNNLLHPGGLVYTECEATEDGFAPDSWRLYKEKKTPRITSRLYRTK